MNSVVEPVQASETISNPLHAIFEDVRLKTLIGGMKSIPTLPTLYSEVMKELKSRDLSLGRIGEIIAKDLGMAAKMLQVVNSPAFGIPTQITSPAQATMFLGMNTTKALVLSLGVFANLDKLQVKEFTTQRLWEHSLRVGLWASRIAESEGLEKNQVDEAFTAGLLHDIGTLALVMNRTSQYLQVMRQVEEGSIPIQTAERKEFKATHAELGAYLVNTWGLPDGIAEAVAFHHSPLKSGNQRVSPLTAVYAADILEYEAVSGDEEPSRLDTDRRYLDAIGRSDRVPAWREICAIPSE
jgi:putative nucleotidyltransferase with HDIG domain